MKSKVSYILYVIALIIVITPIVLEQSGNPLTGGLETLVLVIGLFILIIGKLISAFKRKSNGESSIFHDGVIIAILLGVAVYLLYQYFV